MPITVIFGKNGSGKTTYLKTLNQVKNTNQPQSENLNSNFKHSVFYILPERTGKFQISDPRVAVTQQQQKDMQYSEGNFVANFNGYVLQQFNALFSKLAFRYKQGMQFDFDSESILNEVSKFFPNYEIKFDSDKLELNILLDGSVINANLLSSGESQLVSICLLLLTQINNWKLEGEEGIILFDEPDLHLDPQMQERLASLISNLQQEYGVKFLITTHSIIFLTSLSLINENVGHVYFDRSKSKLFAKRTNREMYDFYAFLNGKFMIGTLNEIPILLVEGADDELIFQTANRNPHFTSYVFPCKGNKNTINHQKFAEKLFDSSYDKPQNFGCALLDGDSGFPENADQKFIKFIKLNCKESENLYFTDEVLKSMIPDVSMLSTRLKKLNIDGRLSDKQNSKFKDVIRTAVNELDQDHLTWQERVGKTIGKQRPTGELANFLGCDLLDIIWPSSLS